MTNLIGNAHNAQIVLLAIIVTFVIVPLLFRLCLKLFEPGPDDVPGQHWWQCKKDISHEWGAEDAAHTGRMRGNRTLPHQRRR